MSNRDGKGAKRNKKHSVSLPNKKCPVCGNSLEKFPNGQWRRFCKTCKYSNF